MDDDGWHYVRGDQSVGPVPKEKMTELFAGGDLRQDSLVWRKGLKNWSKASEVEDFRALFMAQEPLAAPPAEPAAAPAPAEAAPAAAPPRDDAAAWEVGDDDRVVAIKIGADRGSAEAEYGPYTVAQLAHAFRENRVNGRTFVFVPGAPDWRALADTPLFQRVSGEPPPSSGGDRRVSGRRPFVARALFHDRSRVQEGVCRDISVGGLQMLVSGSGVRAGDTIKLNIHPDNGDVRFSASGRVIRLLGGDQGFSLKFENLDEESRALIRRYVDA